MSLINQMLSDLEERRGGVGLDDREVLGGLSAATSTGIMRSVRAPVGALGLIAVIGLIGAGAFWLRPALERWMPVPSGDAPARPVAASTSSPAPVPPAAVAPAAKPVAQPVHAAAQGGPPALAVAVAPPPETPVARQSSPAAAEPSGADSATAASNANSVQHSDDESEHPPGGQVTDSKGRSRDAPPPPKDGGIAQAFAGKTLTFAQAAPVSEAMPVGGAVTTDEAAADAHMGANAKRSPELDARLIHDRHDHGAAAPHITARPPVKTPAAGSTAKRPASSTPDHAVAAKGSVDIRPRRASALQLSQTLYEAALHKLQAGETAGAEIALRKALMENRKNSSARSMLAAVLLQRGRAKAAEELLKEGLVLLPGELHFAMQYARILVEQGKVRSALEVLEEAEPDGTANPQYLAFEGALWQRLGEHQHAVTAYRAALDEDPRQGLWWMGLGISLQALHRRDDALDAFRIALQDRSLSGQLRKFVTARIRSLSSAKS